MSRTRPPLRVHKVEHFAWLADCRRCLFIGAYNSHPLAIEAALFHHDDCLYKTTEQTCHADVLLEIANQNPTNKESK